MWEGAGPGPRGRGGFKGKNGWKNRCPGARWALTSAGGCVERAPEGRVQKTQGSLFGADAAPSPKHKARQTRRWLGVSP